MSTTTTVLTATASGSHPLKKTKAHSSKATEATLRSLYSRATRAFIERDVELTHSLISSAFSIIKPPAPYEPLPDLLETQRRKWEILRITHETTLYSSPPQSSSPELLPDALRRNQSLTPSDLVQELLLRSQRLFTPAFPTQSPSLAYLPGQIVVALAIACLKLECPDTGCDLAESWLATCERVDHIRDDLEGYEKVMDVYCLHVLPRLEEYEHGREYLRLEHRLSESSRQRIKTSLDALENEAEQARQSRLALSPLTKWGKQKLDRFDSPERSPSPTPSTSSIDTTSTHTVVPRTPRGVNGSGSLTSLTSKSMLTNGPSKVISASTTSLVSSTSTVTPSTQPPQSLPNRNRGIANGTIPLSLTTSSSTSLSILSYIQSYIRHHLTFSNFAFVVLMVLFPLISFLFRLRQRRSRNRQLTLAGPVKSLSAAPIAVDEVKRRLKSRASGRNVFKVVWKELVRSVTDAVRMGGSGLV